jgi:hypothetical protein
MKLPGFGLSPRRTKSSIQDRDIRVFRPTLVARSRPYVSVRVELESLLAGGIRKWNNVWGHRNPTAGTRVVLSIRFAVAALCKPQREPAQLDVRHTVDRLHRPRETRTAGPPRDSSCWTGCRGRSDGAHPGGRARVHGDLAAHFGRRSQMAGQVRRRRMTRPATRGEVLAQ